MVREILKMGDPCLLRSAKAVVGFPSEAINVLIADMLDTMRAAGGVGLAAPQIGIDLQIIIFGFERSARYPDAPPVPCTILINPEIVPVGRDMEEDWEGCLSVPGLRGVVPRYKRIRYRGVTPAGERLEREVDGFHARVVQHECDHLRGVLYPMRVTDFSRFGFTETLFPEIVEN